MATEIVVADTVNPNANDPHYSVQLKKGILHGSRWCEPGEVVKLPARQARELCTAGGAEPSGPIANLHLFSAVPLAESAPAPVENQGPKYRLTSGSIFVGSHTYTKESPPFTLPGSMSEKAFAAIGQETPGAAKNRPVLVRA